MKPPGKRIIIDADNPLFKRAYPVLLDLFCGGIQRTSSKQLMLGAGLRILLSPIGWVMDIVFRGLHIAIVLGLWWFLLDDIDALGVSSNLVLTLALVAVLYKEIYQDLLELFLYFLIILTGGGFLRWMYAGYQSGTGFRQWVMTSHLMSGVIGVMVNVVESTCRAKYEEIMDLYLESNDPDKEVRLKAVLDTYMCGSS